MKKALHIILFTFLALLSGCIGAKKGLDVKFKDPSASSSTTTTSDITITSVAVTSNQLIINGTGLGGVTSAKLSRSGVEQSFTIESASATQIIANGAALVTIAVGNVFDLILSDAEGSATFAVSFTLDNHSVDLIKLKTTGATTGQVLKFNGTDWVAASIMDAQIYAGTWDASNNIGGSPDLSLVSSTPGEYYIVSVAGTLGGVSYSVGDWIISNGSSWQKVAASKTAVTSFQGRKGIVTLTPADYVSMRDGVTSKVTGSKIADIADVDLTGIADGKLLKWDATNSKWIVGDDTSGTGTIGLGDLSASAPLSYNSTTGAFSISAATTSAAGSLSSADKTKIDSIPGSGDGLFERFSGTIAMKACSGGEMLVWLAPTGWSCTTGAVALTMGMSRNTTANTAGSALTLQASGATTSATDKNGGSLVLSSGIATGTGSSTIEFKTATASSTGVSDNTPSTKMSILGNGNVGIGTTNPAQKLEVVGTVGVPYNVGGSGQSGFSILSGAGGAILNRLGQNTSSTILTNFEANGFSFNNSGSTLLRIDNSGNVGIGTTSPTAKLSITPGSTSSGAITMTATNGSATFTTSSSTTLNVGDYLIPTTTTGQARAVSVGGTGTSFTASTNFSANVTAETYTVYPAAMNVNSGKLFVQGSTGNMGVGTSAPQANFHVTGSKSIIGDSVNGLNWSNIAGRLVVSNGNLAITNGAHGLNTEAGIRFHFGTGSTQDYKYAGLGSISEDSQSHYNGLFFSTMNNMSYGERMRLSSAGNLGIGTTSPTARLMVTPGSVSSGAVTMSATNGSATFTISASTTLNVGDYLIPTTTTGQARAVSVGGTGTSFTASSAFSANVTTETYTVYPAAMNVNSGKLFVQGSTGNVGIGTTSPSYRLHVLGSSGATVGYFSDGSATCSITPATAGSVSCSSDERLKKNVKEFSDSLSLENVLKLKTVTYEWKKINNGRHTGYIAQEVEKVAPEFVKTGDDGHKQVSYAGFIPWITGAIKAFYSEFKAVVARVMNLETRNEKLEARNLRLEQENKIIKAKLEKIEKMLEKHESQLSKEKPKSP